MASRAYSQCIRVVMLFVLIVGMTSSAVGEFRSHSFSTLSFTTEHFHSHTHSHELDDEYSFYHDASNHSHDKASLRSAVPSFLAGLMDIKNDTQVSGTPVRSPFKIERPPKASLFV